MNNKKGGVGAKIIIVLILMIASAVGGAYGYRVLDGKLAIKDADKFVNSVKLSEYDTPESTEVQGYIDDARDKLESASTRKDVYDIVSEFNENIAKVKTRTQKELEAARKEAEDARNNSYNNNNNDSSNGNDSNFNNNNNNNNNGFGYDEESGLNNNNNSGNSNGSNSNSGNSNSGGSSAITNDDGTSNKPSASGILDTLLGGGDD